MSLNSIREESEYAMKILEKINAKVVKCDDLENQVMCSPFHEEFLHLLKVEAMIAEKKECGCSELVKLMMKEAFDM